MIKKKKKKDDELPDNKWEMGGFLIKHWLKVAVLIILTGIMITGFSFKCGNNEVKKDPIYQRVDSKIKQGE